MSNPPGLLLPTQKSFTPGTGNPRDSAMMANQNMNIKQANLNAIISGGKRRKIRGGATPSQIPVPTMKMQYTPQGGVGTNPNDQIKTNSSTGMQSAAWAVNDSQATNMKNGGSRRRKYRKGGSSDWNWGCYSGGKKYSRKNKTKKNKKTRRHHRKH